MRPNLTKELSTNWSSTGVPFGDLNENLSENDDDSAPLNDSPSYSFEIFQVRHYNETHPAAESPEPQAGPSNAPEI